MNWALKYSALISEQDAQPIFDFIRDACAAMPSRPVARVAGGWIRDQLMGIPSNDIDITVDNMTGKKFGEQLKLFAETDPRYRNQQVIGTIKTTDERPEQIKNLQVSFLRIFGQEMEILHLRGVEFYKEGDRNPTTIDLAGLTQIAKTEGIPAFLQDKAPHLLEALRKLPPEQRNDPLKATEMLDAHRRDLNINAMYYNINTREFEDMTGRGETDIQSMTLNTPLDPVKTFQDDPLRLLRVLRFYSRYSNSQIDPRVIEAMNDEGVQNQITRKIADANDPDGIVPERTSEELRKLMKGVQPEKAVRLMYESGLLAKMLNLPRELEPLNMDQRNRHHQLNVISHTLEVLKNVNNLSREFELSDDQRMMMNIAALFHDLGKLDPRSHKAKKDGSRGYSGDPDNPNAVPHEIASGDIWESFAKALGMSNHETSTVHDLVSSHMRPHAHTEGDIGIASDKQLRKYIRKNPSWVFQYIHAMADSMSKSSDSDPAQADPYRQNLDRLYGLAPNADSFGNQAPAKDVLDGNEIMAIGNQFGLVVRPPPGVKGYIQEVKERIWNTVDDNPGLTKEDATSLVYQMFQGGEFNMYKQARSNWLIKLCVL